ncbi:MAG TPA: Hsp70 family protein [Oligoflexia bacterium]|nr:Hsp70 family protein [Oligoflexia bacterium]HMP49697.1 Hsp70 family protein [Oligoflexia bacterium]
MESIHYIGIDLGTSNCACAFEAEEQTGLNNNFPSSDSDSRISFLTFTQAQDEETIIKDELLPSFCYLPRIKLPKGIIDLLPGSSYKEINEEKKNDDRNSFSMTASEWIPGEIGKQISLEEVERVVHSAKSWLNTDGISRREKILPWKSNLSSDKKISPVDAQAILLSYIKSSWNSSKSGKSKFNNQKIAITVPASFSEEACKLTLEAASMANYPLDSIQLLDEPQAALYANIDNVFSTASRIRKKRPSILVCDIGGGTADFSIYSFTNSEKSLFERVKIGSHLLLGGDNIDLSIAYFIKSKHDLQLSEEEFFRLIQESRKIKEVYFEKNPLPEQLHISILSNKAGNLFNSTRSLIIDPNEIISNVINGFFPLENEDILLDTSYISELGLPYCTDPRITLHLRDFIDGIDIDAVLFNGGTMNNSLFRARIIEKIKILQGYSPQEISSKNLYLSVAEGACRYLGYHNNRKNKPLPVRAGYPRSLYLLVEDQTSNTKAVCILEKGEDRDYWIPLSSPVFKLKTNEECKFILLASEKREDNRGDLVKLHKDIYPVSRISTHLKNQTANDTKNEVDVKLETRIESLRIISLRLASCNNQSSEISENEEETTTWPLSFSIDTKKHLKDVFSNQIEVKVENSRVLPNKAKDLIQSFFGKSRKTENNINPKDLIRLLENIISEKKSTWNYNSCRAISDELISVSSRRSRSMEHETTWLQLTGFCLRPGFGYPGDENRIENTRETLRLGLFYKKEKINREAWALFWRRISGGLPSDMQNELFKDTIKNQQKERFSDPEECRLLASIEEVNLDEKIKLKNLMLAELKRSKKKNEALLWALARLSTRYTIRGNDLNILPAVHAEEIVDKIISLDLEKKTRKYALRLLLFAQEERMDNLDISASLREKLLRECAQLDISIEKLNETENSSYRDNLLYGDDLPVGLKIVGI